MSGSQLKLRQSDDRRKKQHGCPASGIHCPSYLWIEVILLHIQCLEEARSNQLPIDWMEGFREQDCVANFIGVS